MWCDTHLFFGGCLNHLCFQSFDLFIQSLLIALLFVQTVLQLGNEFVQASIVELCSRNFEVLQRKTTQKTRACVRATTKLQTFERKSYLTVVCIYQICETVIDYKIKTMLLCNTNLVPLQTLDSDENTFVVKPCKIRRSIKVLPRPSQALSGFVEYCTILQRQKSGIELNFQK